MSQQIIVPPEIAAYLREATAGDPRRRLEPEKLMDGTFAVPEEVGSAAEYEAFHALLSVCDRRPVEREEYEWANNPPY